METRTATPLDDRRRAMVRQQIEARGIHDPRVLHAMRSAPREAFVPEPMREFAFEDSALPIEQHQTISQPYIVAFMTEALELRGGEKVLEIGTGSGYAAAVLAEIADEVVTIERHRALADTARQRLHDLGYDSVQIVYGDGTRGYPEAAPYDAIVVAAGGPEVPKALRNQLKVGGRLVIPVGASTELQKLVRVRRLSKERFETEELLEVRFVPLVGEGGFRSADDAARPPVRRDRSREIVVESAETFDDIQTSDITPLLQRLARADVVLLGEATHGTSEFYAMRARITKELVSGYGFDCIALEADWPDAARIDDWVRLQDRPPADWVAFSRFPMWMWRNREFRELVDWLRHHNAEREPDRRTGVYGLDIYSMSSSIDAVLRYLEDVDPEAARTARQRYGCLEPWQSDPASYGRAAWSGRYHECEDQVVANLKDLLAKRLDYAGRLDGERLFDAEQNARLVQSAERYYRAIYHGGADSWNLRDEHMFETLRRLIGERGPRRRAIVWAHNSHLGDASATEMSARGEHNLGQLCREAFGPLVRNVGFGTHAGTVAAAANWGDRMQVFELLDSHQRSYERLFHETGLARAVVPLRGDRGEAVRPVLAPPRLERMVGVVYRPESERLSHYVHAELTRQFDEWIWFDRSRAVEPLEAAEVDGVPDTYPFGL